MNARMYTVTADRLFREFPELQSGRNESRACPVTRSMTRRSASTSDKEKISVVVTHVGGPDEDMAGSNGVVSVARMYIADGKDGPEVSVVVKKTVRSDDHAFDDMFHEALIGTLISRNTDVGGFLRNHVCSPLFVMEDPPVLLMRYYEGGTLQDALCGSYRPMMEDRMIEWAVPLADTVWALHHVAKIAHCDLKANNICFDGDGRLKVIDFGMSIVLDRMTDCDWATQLGSVVRLSSRFCYYCPRHDASPTQQDVYSLGVLMFIILIGEPLYTRDCFESELAKWRSGSMQKTPFQMDVLNLVVDCLDGSCDSCGARDRIRDIGNASYPPVGNESSSSYRSRTTRGRGTTASLLYHGTRCT